MNVSERQSFLERTIEPFPQETYAYWQCLIFAIGSPIVMIIATLLQFSTYLLYNRSFHPFYILVKGFKAPQAMEMTEK